MRNVFRSVAISYYYDILNVTNATIQINLPVVISGCFNTQDTPIVTASVLQFLLFLLFLSSFVDVSVTLLKSSSTICQLCASSSSSQSLMLLSSLLLLPPTLTYTVTQSPSASDSIPLPGHCSLLEHSIRYSFIKTSARMHNTHN